jgi:hypothetical protein
VPDVSQYAGIRALWVKVIIRAIYDFVNYRNASGLTQLKWSREAYNWMFNTDPRDGSFNGVCYHLDINPEAVRAWARTATKRQVAKIEYLDRIKDPKKRQKFMQDVCEGLRSRRSLS